MSSDMDLIRADLLRLGLDVDPDVLRYLDLQDTALRGSWGEGDAVMREAVKEAAGRASSWA